MHLSPSKFSRRFSAVLLGLGFGALHAAATDSYFNNNNGNQLYLDAANWSPSGVPDLTTANTAHIANGSAVSYVAGPDLVIKNGGVLEITSGSFTQTTGPAYLQLNGTGTILVDGGTFNQGTATSGPFNVTGTGNVFNMTSGAANFNHGFMVLSGLTSTLSGGTLTTTGGATTVNSSLTLSGANATLGQALTINANGTLAVSAGTVSTSGGLTNSGALTVSGGSLGAGGNLANGSNLSITGGSLSATGNTTNTNTLTISAGSYSGSGGLTNSGTLTIAGGTFGATGEASNSGALTIANATVNTGKFVNNGSFAMSSGTLTTTGEFDFNNNQNTLSGGTINTTLITGVNGAAGNHVFNISGGALTLSSSFGNGIYGGDATKYINFTLNSSGYIDFLASTGANVGTIQNFISKNVIEYNDTPYNATTGFSNFSITPDGAGGYKLSLANVAVPEPATFAAGGLLAAFAAPAMARRLRRSPGRQKEDALGGPAPAASGVV